LRYDRIGKIGFIENLQTRALAMQAQLFDDRITTGSGIRASSTSMMTSMNSIVLAASLRAEVM